MKVNDKYYYFLYLAGNCEGMGYLGKDRIRGPVDNVVTKGVKCLKKLFTNDYFNSLYKDSCTMIPKQKQFDNDCEYIFEFDFVKILHNNITDLTYKKSLEKRIDTFNDFLFKVINRCEHDHFFVLNLNEYDVDYTSSNHVLKNDNFIEMLEYLKEQGVINQCIVVQTKLSNPQRIENRNDFTNEYLDNIDELSKKYGFSYFTIIDNDVWNTDKPFKQFEKQFKKLIDERESQ